MRQVPDDPTTPRPLRRLRAVALGSLISGLVLAASIVAIAALSPARGTPVSVTYLALIPVYVGVIATMLVERRRKALLKHLRRHDWRLCTGCTYPLNAETTTCPECGVPITAERAAAAWKQCRLAHQ